MDVNAYLSVINKNNNFRLDPDEMKDVKQELQIYLSGKNYNDELTRYRARDYYVRAVKRKIRSEELVQSQAYLSNFDESAQEITDKRLEEMGSLKLNDIQKKIIEMLINGFKYPDIRKRLKLNEAKLKNQILRIKQKNCPELVQLERMSLH